jgi:GWxTD domain-containing protein
MKNKRLPILAAGILLSWLLAGAQSQKAQKIREQDLAGPYQDWLKLVQYIIQPVEKEVFLKLTSDRDRDIFIETFWKQRDPTPGTPENEYKDEHIKRFNYANTYYGRGTTRKGWQTDMGRIYIILGPPVSIERFESTSWVLPCQAWSYNGDPEKNLPPHFVLLFYQRGGIGDYRLYDPVSDGPAALIVDKRDIDPFDYEALYEKLKNLAPTLAEISISIVPGEYNMDFSPSTRNSIIMASIFESPRKDVNPSYATHFLNYRGIVSTEYMTNYVDCDSDVSLIEDPVTGIPFVHFSMAPKSMSIDYYEPKDQYYCSFRLDISLREGEKIIFQYNRDFPIYFTEKDTGRIQANGVSIEDAFPVVPGKHHLIILLQNSVGKEFSLREMDIVVPETAGGPRLSGPFLGYKLENYGAQVHIPYKIQDRKLVVDPKKTFASGEDLAFLLNVVGCSRETWQKGEVKVLIKGMRESNPQQKSISMRLGDSLYGRIISLAHSLPLSELAPDYYEIRVSLLDAEGRALDEAVTNFVLSPERILPHPIANAKGFPLSNRFFFHHMLARQYDLLNVDDRAETEYERVVNSAPEYREAAVDYANFLLKVKNYSRAAEINERVKEDEKFKFEYFLIRGRAQMGLGNYGDAIASFLEGNKIYNSDTRLLNSLGLCYFKTGEKQRALETLGFSLRLNPEQEEIKKLVKEIEKS